MKKIGSKDLITIGIFTTLFLAGMFIVSALQVTPMLSMAMPAMCALISGPIYLLFVARTKKMFCITILGFLVSLVAGLFVFGNVYIFLFNFIIFIIAEVIAYIGKYKNFKINYISYIFLSLWIFGEVGSYWVASDWMRAKSIAAGVDLEFVEQTFLLATPKMLCISVIITIICAALSGLLSKHLFKKHFKRVGMI